MFQICSIIVCCVSRYRFEHKETTAPFNQLIEVSLVPAARGEREGEKRKKPVAETLQRSTIDRIPDERALIGRDVFLDILEVVDEL